MNIIIIAICLLSIGCVTSQQTFKERSSAKTSSPAIKSPAENVGSKKPVRLSAEALQDQKDKELLLKRKSELSAGQVSARVSAAPQRRSSSLSVMPVKNWGPELMSLSENDLYNQLFVAYEKNDELGFRARLKVYMQKYSQSSRADEALYLAGMNSAASHDYGSALKYFKQVLKDYAFSNRAPAALFGKAAVFKKMDLMSNARDTFKQVLAQFPQSPESERAQVELRLFK